MRVTNGVPDFLSCSFSCGSLLSERRPWQCRWGVLCSSSAPCACSGALQRYMGVACNICTAGGGGEVFPTCSARLARSEHWCGGGWAWFLGCCFTGLCRQAYIRTADNRRRSPPPPWTPPPKKTKVTIVGQNEIYHQKI